MKQYFKSKTINFSVLIGILGMLEMNMPMIKEQLGDYYGFVFIGIATISILLRAVTTKPLSEK